MNGVSSGIRFTEVKLQGERGGQIDSDRADQVSNWASVHRPVEAINELVLRAVGVLEAGAQRVGRLRETIALSSENFSFVRVHQLQLFQEPSLAHAKRVGLTRQIAAYLGGHVIQVGVESTQAFVELCVGLGDVLEGGSGVSAKTIHAALITQVID